MNVRIKVILGILLCIAGLTLSVVASQQVTTDQYRYNKGQVDYYEQQARESSGNAYGMFASDYRYLASQWDEMADDARGYISAQNRNATILIVVGVSSLVAGVVLVIKANKGRVRG